MSDADLVAGEAETRRVHRGDLGLAEEGVAMVDQDFRAGPAHCNRFGD